MAKGVFSFCKAEGHGEVEGISLRQAHPWAGELRHTGLIP